MYELYNDLQLKIVENNDLYRDEDDSAKCTICRMTIDHRITYNMYVCMYT